MPGRGTCFAREGLDVGGRPPADHADAVTVARELTAVRHWSERTNEKPKQQVAATAAMNAPIKSINGEKGLRGVCVLGIVWKGSFKITPRAGF